MRILCEVVVTDILPAIRALITGELMHTYGMNQSEISKKLGLTQPAVSQYKSGLRGTRVKAIQSKKTIMDSVKKLSSEIASHEYNPVDIHVKICQLSDKIIKEKIFGEEIMPGPCIVEGRE